MKRWTLWLLFIALSVPQMAFAAAEVHFSFFQWIPGINAGNQHVFVMALVAVLLVLASLSLKSTFASKEALVPSGSFGLRSLFEMIAETMMGMMREVIGPDYKKFVPLIGTFAFFILFANLIGLIPGAATSNNNLNTTAAMAIVAFIAYNYAGVKVHGGLGWLAHFMGPLEGNIKYIMAPLMIPIEIVSHLARPTSLALRLFGNITGDHMVLGVFMGLVSLPLIFPLPFLVLGLVVSVVQTLVFCLLTMVYIGQAVVHEEH